MTIISVERTTVELGSLRLEVFQDETGDYALSMTQVLDAVGINKSWFSSLEKKTPNVLKWLTSNGFRGWSDARVSNDPKARKVKLITA